MALRVAGALVVSAPLALGTGAALTLAAVTLALPGQAMAAPVTPASGNTSITAADTWDIDANVGANDANIIFDNSGGAVSLTVTSQAAGDAAADIGAVSIGSDAGTTTLTVGGTANPITLTVNGAVTGTSTTPANNLAIIVDGSAAGAAAIDFKGNVNLGTGGPAKAITLTDGGGGATITFSGTAAQAVTGTIDGNADANGAIVVDNANGSGVTFNSAIGGSNSVNTIAVGNGAAGIAVFGGTVNANGNITVGTGTNNGTATFKNTVTAGGIVLGGTNAASTNAVTFDATGGSFGVTGAISTAGATPVNSLTVIGGNTVTFNSAIDIGTTGDTITIGADSANQGALFKGSVTAASITVGAGANADTNTLTFDSAGGATTVTGAISEGNAADTTVINVTGTAANGTIIASDVNIGTLAGDVITVGSDDTANGAKLSLRGDVTAGSIVLGGGTTAGTNTLVFDKNGTSAVNAAISGGAATDTNAIVVGGTNGNTTVVNLSQAIGSNINTLTIDAEAANAAATLNTTKNISATTITLKADTGGANNAALTVNSNGANTVTVAGAVAMEDAAGNGNAVLTLTNDQDGIGTLGLTGSITTNTTGNGALVIGDTTAANITAATVTGSIGATGTRLASVTIKKASTLAVTGDVYATTLTLGDTAGTTLTLSGTTAQTIGASITGTANIGAVAVNNDVTFGTGSNETIANIASMTVANGKTATLAGTGAVDVNTITLAGASGSTLAVTGAKTITSDIDSDSNAKGVVTIGENTTVVGSVGTTNGLSSVTVADNKTLTIDANAGARTLKATTITLANSGNGATLALDNANGAANTITVTGAVATATTGKGAIALGATNRTDATFNGAVGSSSAALNTASVANSSVLTAKGNYYVNTTTLNGAASGLTFSGTSAQTFGGAVAAGGAGEGVVTFSNDVTLTSTGNNVLGSSTGDKLASITIDAGKSLTTAGATGFNATTITNSGTLNLANTLSVTGTTLELGGNAASKIVMSSPSTSYSGGTLISATGSTVDATNAVSFVPHSTFNSGSLTLVDGNGAAGTANDSVNKWNVTSNALTTYTVSIDGSNDVILTATQKSAGAIAGTLGTTTEAVNALAAGVEATKADTTVANAYNTALLAGGSEAKKAAEQSQPNVTASAGQAITSAARGSAGAVAARLASARTGVQVAGLQETGVAAGDGAKRNGGWAKAFGNIANQDDRDGVAGYDSHTYGVAVGMDNKVTETVRLGAALSYANSDVDGNDSGNSQSDIDSYQVAVYGSYEPGKYYVEGQVAYAYNKVDTSRQITFGGLNRTASGSYDANQYTATLGAGVPLKQNAFTITPKAGLFYSYTDPDKYTETGAGALNLEVTPDATSILEGSLGVVAAYDHKTSAGVVRPEARAAVLYEFLGDTGAATSKFTGAGASFETKGLEPAQLGGTLGFGVGYTTADGVWEIRGDYDAELREDFVGHSGMLTGRINF